MLADLIQEISDIPITSPTYWIDNACTDDVLKHVFRSATTEPMPLLEERISNIRNAGKILHDVGLRAFPRKYESNAYIKTSNSMTHSQHVSANPAVRQWDWSG